MECHTVYSFTGFPKPYCVIRWVSPGSLTGFHWVSLGSLTG